MDCVNHSGITATAYCQSCGKALCAGCVHNAAGGQLLCEPCLTAWQSYQQPFISPPAHGPNPSSAAVLGLIPGVGAMYNGQFIKGFIHVVVFAVLVSLTGYYGVFGFFIAAWICYQSFEAYQTARALRDGLQPPDPLGLNELSSLLTLGTRPRNPGQPVAGQPAAVPPTGGYQPPPPYQAPFTPPAAGFVDPAAPPPPPPMYWRRREPVGAIVLIALGVLFLLGQLDVFRARFFGLTWPLLLIALGVWLIIRRFEDSQGGSK
ncbi:MAG: B-box zinc finger protein [Terracidiphilus sp.]|jgi:TM2 domain-containing membrane protein YozV